MRSAATIVRHGLAVLCAAVVLSTVAPPTVTAARTRVIVRIAAGHSSVGIAAARRADGRHGRPDPGHHQRADCGAAGHVDRHAGRSSARRRSLARSHGGWHDGADVGDHRRVSRPRESRLRRQPASAWPSSTPALRPGMTTWPPATAVSESLASSTSSATGQRPYDDYGHGTHVAGIIAGDGFDSGGARTGVAPGARLTILKVLDDQGNGRISDVIAAFDYILKNRAALNIRVVNLSVATGVLRVVHHRPVDARRQASGRCRASSWSRPPETWDERPAAWTPTAGSPRPATHRGCSRSAPRTTWDRRSAATIGWLRSVPVDRPLRTSAPSRISWRRGWASSRLSNPDSTFYRVLSPYLLDGTVPTAYRPYLSLTGTSMAAPVVTGTIALMLQANPALTPNAVKAILQYTAEVYPGYDPLTQGAGFLNAAGAVELSRSFSDRTTSVVRVRTPVVEPPRHLGQSAHHQRAPGPRRQRVGSRRDLGRREHNVQRRRGAKRRLGQAVWR